MTIVSKKQVYYNKELIYNFGDYVQANEDSNPKNNNLPQTLDCIYLQRADCLQGGHESMDLTAGKLIRRPQVEKVKMKKMVIARVELLARRQGY